MNIKVKIGDVFKIKWSKNRPYKIYKLYQIKKYKSPIGEYAARCVKIDNGAMYLTFFAAEKVSENEVILPLTSHAKWAKLSRLETILYEYEMDKYWKKHF